MRQGDLGEARVVELRRDLNGGNWVRKARRAGRKRPAVAALSLSVSARAERIQPTSERLRQGPVEISDTKVARGLDVLDLLQRNGTIDDAMVEAGRRFQRAFHRAALDPLRVADLGRLPGGGHELPDQVMDARALVHKAVTALGGFGAPCTLAAWWVIGHGESIAQWTRRESNGRSVPLNEYVAKGIVIGALGVLVEHYRWSGKAHKTNIA